MCLRMPINTASVLKQVDADGKEIAAHLLNPGEDITTPPVAGPDGHVYVGTAKGIYCFR